jgi:DnaJ-class molecular chaperone
MSEKLSDLMFQFIVDNGLRSKWDKYFEANQPDPEDVCPDCNGSGEYVYGGSFGGPTHHQNCFNCKGTGIKPKDDEKSIQT